MRFPIRIPEHFPKRLPRIRFPDFRFLAIHLPVLTAGEKTALAALVLVLGAGTALRVWERSGVSLGPVDDWESLRGMLIDARGNHEKNGGGGFACADEAPAGFYASDGSAGAAPEILAAGAAPTKKSAGGKKGAPARPVDLNVAGEKALLSLPGVGPSTAKAILAHRAARGPFRGVEDLLQVKGVGPKKLEALRPFVKVVVPMEARGEAPGFGDSTDSRAQGLTATGSPAK